MIALPTLAAPAKRALTSKGVESLDDLSLYTRREVARWHGIGPSALRVLEMELIRYDLAFKKEEPST